MHVVHVHCQIDPHCRAPRDLLDAWFTARIIAEAGVDAGAKVTVLIASQHSAEIERGGVRYRFIQERRFLGRRGGGIEPWKLARAVAAERPDVVHLHGFGFPIHTRAICAAGFPVLVQDHANKPAARFAPVARWGLAKISGASFTSAEQAAPFQRSDQIARHVPVFEVLENSTEFTPGDRDEARLQSGVTGSPAVLWAGRLNAGKDPLTALRALREARKAEPDMQLYCAFGSDELRPEIDAFLQADPDLAAHVHLLGQVPHAQVQTLCRACDLFVSTSHHESAGYAVLEALACGLVPVLSAIPPFQKLTGNGAVGHLAAIGDVDGFAEAIAKAAADWRGGARAAVLEHFDRDLSKAALGRSLMAAYESIAKQGTGA